MAGQEGKKRERKVFFSGRAFYSKDTTYIMLQNNTNIYPRHDNLVLKCSGSVTEAQENNIKYCLLEQLDSFDPSLTTNVAKSFVVLQNHKLQQNVVLLEFNYTNLISGRLNIIKSPFQYTH